MASLFIIITANIKSIRILPIFCARIMNLQMETMTDNNEMNAGNGTPCCHCHGEECRCREENGECECHCHAHETLYPGVTCIDVEPDDFNDWD